MLVVQVFIQISCKSTELQDPTVNGNRRDLFTIDKDVVQYVIYYSVTRNMFDKFLSVAEDMVNPPLLLGLSCSAIRR